LKRIGILMLGIFACLIFVGWAQSPPPAAAYTIRTIDPPDSIETFATGINARGDIVGQFVDGSGLTHGYLLSKGSFHVVDVPGALETRARGINSRGEIVGSYSGGHGFLLSGRNFRTFDFPGGVDTFPRAINDAGGIVGNYSEFTDGPIHGFLLSHGRYTGIAR